MAVVKGLNFSLTTAPKFNWQGVQMKGDGPELTEDVIKGSYVNDYNIERVDALIRKKLDRQRAERAGELQKQLAELARQLGEWLNVIVKKTLTKEYQSLEQELQKILQGTDLEKYLEQATPLLELYRQLRPQQQTRTFGAKETISESDEDKFRRVVIDQYLELARQFIRVELCNEQPPKVGCTICGQKDPLL